MSTRTMPARGQPLWALGGILLGWAALRTLFFDASALAVPEVLLERPAIARILHPRAIALAPSLQGEVGSAIKVNAAADRVAPIAGLAIPAAPGHPPPRARTEVVGPALPVPSVRQALAPATPDAAVTGQAAPETLDHRPQRWSADGWLAWRQGTGQLAAGGAALPSYGASQAGAVLRYDLAPGSRHRPQVFVRTVHALNGAAEGDLAAGLALRPLPGMALTAHGEARLSRRGDRVALRPAAFFSTGVDDRPLGAGLTARGYGQAGYVGGPDGTAFADGSLIVERALPVPFGPIPAAIGAGAWGGAQRGAERLDIGPTASLPLRLGQARARLSADYRLRVAGNAAPAGGAALTLSAGF